MLRQLRLTAERTVTRAGNIQVLTAKPRLENAPRPARIFFRRGFAPVSAVAIYPAFNDEPVTWPW